ncbi:unnamed protein product [Rotaria sp. Silwood1]|nr:unnamed protein product [Rotaria sp. Silwood1]CAF3364460.1 unnamed protein product [Rotaria sp. Silwood1]CAF3365087.1 unnamed protein product [Rotaria sp. Silwood1]CAF3369031.1 unnamed protein product [Rotaria sp. Silwood1]CAF4564152.1 unnamed protein product [Rotaria sp. Silwood1]
MRSDLESSFGACFRLNDYNLQISRPVAQVLLAAGVIEKSQLTLISTHDWPTLKHGNRIEACTRGLRRTISRLADSVHPSKRSKSASYLERTRSMSTLNMIKYDLINVEQPFKDNLQLYGEIKEQPKEEHDEDSKLAEKVKRGVHYDLPTAVKNSSVLNRSRSTLGTFSSSTMNSLRKNNSKSRPVDNIIQHSPYQNKQIRTIRNAQTNKTNRDSFLVKQQPSLQLKDQNNSKSPEQKAANMSGLSIDICKEILDDFNQIKSDRHHFNEKSKYRMGISILPILYRPRSHPTVVH